MTLDDEFNGTALDQSLWIVDNNYRCGPDQKCLATRWADNVSVSDGALHLLTKKQERVSGFPWTTGGISSRDFTQTFGYIEARIRYGAADGLNNAFWLHSVSGDRSQFEIDVNEGHFSSQVNMTLRDAVSMASVADQITMPDNLASDFHVYGVEWDPDTVSWYVDGALVWKQTNPWANGEAKVFLTTMVMNWAGNPGSDLDGTSMDVDWIRVYRKAN